MTLSRIILLGTKGGPALRRGDAIPCSSLLLAAHTPAADAGRIAAAAGVGHLVLSHLVPSDDDRVTEADWRAAVGQTWNGPLTVGRDGLEISLP